MTIPSPSRTRVAISLGSNIQPAANLAAAVRELRRSPRVEVVAVGRSFETEAVGGAPDAPAFRNAAVVAVTDLEPEELRAELRRIEARLGRVRTEDRFAPRTIDLDIAYYGNLRKDFEGWSVPDPDIPTAAHVAVPLADVVPEWIHPELGVATKTLAETLGSEGVRPVMAIQLPHHHRHADDDFEVVYDGEVYAPRYEALVREQLLEIGEDPNREGLLRTPLRVAKAMDFLTSGYATTLDDVVNNAVFDAEGAEEMVLVKDIEFYSMCEHHMLPFYGKAAVGYLPRNKIIGLSKIARIVDLYARRLQVQERMTNQVADTLLEVLDPYGTAVVIEGKHFCMMMRGVQKQDSAMITSSMRGTFKDDARTRQEFLDLVRG